MSLADDLVKKWQPVLDRGSHIWTWTEPHSLAYCCERAQDAEFGVELGTYLGASAFVMLEANPGLHLWCVDLFYEIGIQKAAEYFLRRFIDAGRCEIIKGDSARAAAMLPHMNQKLDFVWVDDGHSEEDLRRDLTSFIPLMAEGKVIFGHDWDGNNDVAKGVKSVLPENQISVPVPRVWNWTVQPFKKKCCK